MLLLLAACNGSDGGPGPGTNDTGPVSSTAIGPDGGTAESADGRFVLVIPPGALSEDVDITIAEQASDGPIGVEWELGPDGLEFAEPARATITMDLSDTTIVQEDGSYAIPALENVSGDTAEQPGGLVYEIGEEFVVSADVEHFSRIRTLGGVYEVTAFVFPSIDDTRSTFDQMEGATVSTAVELRGLTAEFDTAYIEVSDKLTRLERLGGLEPVAGEDDLRRASGGRVRCDDEGSVTITHFLLLTPDGIEIQATVPGICRAPEEPDRIADLGAVEVYQVIDGEAVFKASDGLSGIRLDDANSKVRHSDDDTSDAVFVPGALVYITDGGLVVRDDENPSSGTVIDPDVTDTSTLDVVDGMLRVANPETGLVIYYVYKGSETFEEFDRVRYDTDHDALRRASRAEHHAGQPGGTVDTVDSPDGAILELNDGVIKGSLWGGPLQDPIDGGQYGIDGKQAGPSSRVNGQPLLPFTCEDDDGAPCVGVGTFINGQLMVGTQPLADCDNPSGAACDDDGRCWTACDDGSLVATEPFIEEDLDRLADCQDDLYELQDPRIPLTASGVTMQIGQEDTSDGFKQTFDVPADCKDPYIAVTIQGFGAADYTIDGAPPEDGGQGGFDLSMFTATPGTTETIEFDLAYEGDCVEYSIAARVECDVDPDANEDDDEDYNGTELGDGEQIVLDLSIDPKDKDWFYLPVSGECDVEVEVTDDQEGLDVNPFILTGHGQLAVEVAEVSGGLPGSQTLNFTGIGPLFVEIESAFAGVDSYDVSFNTQCPFDCYRDTYEPNNTYAQRDVYDTQYVEDSWGGETMTVSPADTDWWEFGIDNFGCSSAKPDLFIDVTLGDGEDGATLLMSLTDKLGNTWVSDHEFTTDERLRVPDILDESLSGTDFYIEWWAEGGCQEFTVDYEVLCQ